MIKNTVLSLPWRVEPTEQAKRKYGDQIPPDVQQRIDAATFCFRNPNDSESWRDVSSAVLEDLIVGDYGTAEPRLTPDFRRPWKWWSVDGTTIRIYADWSESMPEKPKFAQLTGLKGERGIISFRDDELSYMRANVRSSTPFGLGKLEVCFNTVNAFLGVQDMSARSAADQIHKTWLWWASGKINPYQLQTIRRQTQNEIEGEGKISLMSGLEKPDVLEINPVTPQDLLLDWQTLLIRIISAGFDLSAMALGVENDVNRSTSETLSEMDFKSGAVPMAVCYAEHLNRDILWKLLGWRDLQFVYIGLDDPDAQIQATLNETAYRNNVLTSDEWRAELGLPPLAGGWGQLTAGQWEIMANAARAGGQQKQTPPPLPVLANMPPEQIAWFQKMGFLPNYAETEEETEAGPLAVAQEQLENFTNLSKNRKQKGKKLSSGQQKALQKAQGKRYKATEHELTREEKMARDIEKRRQQALTTRPRNSRSQGNEFSGSLPGGVG